MCPPAPQPCRHCGADPAADPQARLTWSPGADAGTGTPTWWLCPACAREQVRGIEARLDPAWW